MQSQLCLEQCPQKAAKRPQQLYLGEGQAYGTLGLTPSLLPRAWPCKLTLTFRALAFELPPIQCETQREREGREREKPLPARPRATPPTGARGLQGLFAQLGRLLAPHLQEKGTTRSSVYSRISGSQRELFSSQMKRKQTICQVNRRHCFPMSGPFCGLAFEAGGSLVQGQHTQRKGEAFAGTQLREGQRAGSPLCTQSPAYAGVS